MQQQQVSEQQAGVPRAAPAQRAHQPHARAVPPTCMHAPPTQAAGAGRPASAAAAGAAGVARKPAGGGGAGRCRAGGPAVCCAGGRDCVLWLRLLLVRGSRSTCWLHAHSCISGCCQSTRQLQAACAWRACTRRERRPSCSSAGTVTALLPLYCCRGRQKDFVDVERAMGRTDPAAISALVGYAGGTQVGPDGKVRARAAPAGGRGLGLLPVPACTSALAVLGIASCARAMLEVIQNARTSTALHPAVHWCTPCGALLHTLRCTAALNHA